MNTKQFVSLETIEKGQFNKKESEEIEKIFLKRVALRKLKEERERKNLTQNDISHISGLSRSTISKIETGNRNVSIDKLIQIANAMDMNIEIRLIPKKRDKTSSNSH